MVETNFAYDERTANPRFELIGGEEKMLARPAVNHAAVAANITRIFTTYLRGKRCRFFAEVDVFFDEKNRLVPDAMIVCDKSKIKINGIHGAPDLVAEILSPSTAKDDRGRKKQIYEKFGVKEYWLVNPTDKSVEVYHNATGEFVLDDVYHEYTDETWEMLNEREKAAQKFSVKVSLYEDLAVTVKEIFEDVWEV